MSALSQQTAALLDRAVERCTAGKDVAVAFSGGLDSGLVAALAKRYASSVTLYTVGAEDSPDVQAARLAAPLLGAELAVIPLADADLVGLLQEEIRVTGTTSPLVLAFEIPLFCLLRDCRQTDVVGGQGADEIFAGYAKYRGLSAVPLREAMAKDLQRLYAETKPHEAKVAAHFGRTLAYPYLDRELVALIRNAPAEAVHPMDEDLPKKILRDAAADLGYGFLAERPKKAAQYGSGAMDALHRVCKARGTTYNELVAVLAKRA